MSVIWQSRRAVPPRPAAWVDAAQSGAGPLSKGGRGPRRSQRRLRGTAQDGFRDASVAASRPLGRWKADPLLGPLLALYHGLRLGEVAGLQVRDVGEENGQAMLLIRSGKRQLKTNAARPLEISSRSSRLSVRRDRRRGTGRIPPCGLRCWKIAPDDRSNTRPISVVKESEHRRRDGGIGHDLLLFFLKSDPAETQEKAGSNNSGGGAR